MLTSQQKNEILELVEDEKQRLGSYRAVANKCRISEATISQLRKGSYAAEGDDIYTTIALALGYSFDSGTWSIAETTNFRIITDVLTDAKSESMFLGIAHRAGSGKTATSDVFLSNNKRNGTFKINCKEWNGRVFLAEIVREIGAEMPKGYASVNAMIDSVAEAFKRMAYTKPLLILDQANSLKPSSMRTLIHLFNECEDILALVILGTDNLEYEIKRGVRLNKPGYDEIDSRFGRKYIHLIGATLADTRKICEVNGITGKEDQSRIFHDCEPSRITIEEGKTILAVEDIRRLKRLIKSKRIQMRHAS
jgi:transcriptional regulator with XRE-family HTH domain